MSEPIKVVQTTRMTWYKWIDEDGDLWDAVMECDYTCENECDGHEAPGDGVRCRYCYWKPCRCKTMESNQTLMEQLRSE